MKNDEYRELFVAESRENHENIVKSLLVLEDGADDEAIDEIFRSAHTLKGMSASMGFMEMEQLCHKMEDVFALIRNKQLAVCPALVDVLLTCTDTIEEMLDDIEAGGGGSCVRTAEAIADLLRIAEDDTDEILESVPDEISQPSSGSVSEPNPESVRYRITAQVEDSCLMKDIRAMIILQNLQEFGRIISCVPDNEKIEKGEFDGELEVLIESDAGIGSLETAAAGPEISSVIVIPEESAKVGAKPEVSEEPLSTDRPEESSVSPRKREVKNIRVDISRLDQMMNHVEELVINGGRIKQIAQRYQLQEMDEALGIISRTISDLQNLMMKIRMIPLNHIFNRFPRVVRDVAHHDGKEVELVIEGGETELDRSVMDNLSDPLLHLIRNGVNHGIESPEERRSAGKPEKGTLHLSARREQDNVIIELADDGAGIDPERIREKAIDRGLVTREEAGDLTPDEILAFLFQRGFSTADQVTDISGRGVGLDVVKNTVESLNGSIVVHSEPGMGTRFRLALPPTMAIVEVMMVRINNKRCAIPLNVIVEVAQIETGGTHKIGSSEVVMLRDEFLQINSLEEMFGRQAHYDTIVVVQYQGRKCCIPVDMVEGQQEVVVKPVGGIIGACRGIGGITIPGDGVVVPVLDVNTMV